MVAELAAWVRRFEGGGEAPTLVANAGDEGVREVIAALDGWAGRLVAVAVVDEAENLAVAAERLAAGLPWHDRPSRIVVGRWRTSPAGEGSLEIRGLDRDPAASAVASIGLAGRHNTENGLVAAGVALAAGADPASIVAGLGSFEGVGRRLELKGEVGGVAVLDDYGHHPTAMAATFAAVAQRYPGRRLWAVYEPLTYHRTAAMLEAFADVLERADRAVIAQVHAGRDPDTTITSAAALAEAVARRGRTSAWAPGTVEETADWLASRVEPGDVVLVMGGGRSYVIAERLLEHLRRRGGR